MDSHTYFAMCSVFILENLAHQLAEMGYLAYHKRTRVQQ